MKINEYQRLAMKTLNPKLKDQDLLINGVMGLNGEAGEVIDHVKKHLHQGHKLDKDQMIKELGDVTWYIAELATYLEIPMEEIFIQNIEKLKKRFPEGFKEEASIDRE